MENYCVLFNPKSGNGRGADNAHRLDLLFPGDILKYVDITAIENIRAYLEDLPVYVTPVLAGGDGTINHFINALDGEVPSRDILYYATGTGNDFLHDLGLNKNEKEAPFLLNPYLKDLPKVHVKGMTRYFINGIGYVLTVTAVRWRISSVKSQISQSIIPPLPSRDFYFSTIARGLR